MLWIIQNIKESLALFESIDKYLKSSGEEMCIQKVKWYSCDYVVTCISTELNHGEVHTSAANHMTRSTAISGLKYVI